MKSALTAKKPLYPAAWNELPVGDELKSQVEASLEDSCRSFFGYHLIKVGCLSREIELPGCTINHRIDVVNKQCAQKQSTNKISQVIADSHELPFTEGSIDAAILAHEMDFSRDPHQILREIDRVLIPNGHVVIVGFNPFSLAGIFRFLPFTSNKIVREARFFSRFRIKDWLHLLGFEVIDQQQLAFSSLLFKKKYRVFSGIEKLCRKYLPIFASVYVVVAKKRVVPMSLIKPKWKPAPKFAPVRASMRNSLENNFSEKNLL